MPKETSSKNKSPVAAVKAGQKPVGWTKFNPEWLVREEFKEWLRQISPYEFRCLFCNSTRSVKDDGIRAVRKHSETASHQSAVKSRGLMKGNPGMKGYLTTPGSTEERAIAIAECVEAYHSVKHHHSYRSLDCGIKASKNVFLFAKNLIAYSKIYFFLSFIWSLNLYLKFSLSAGLTN